MREMTLTDVERLSAFDDAERTFLMNEEAFRVFYELTARPVRVYLARMTGNDRQADDLLQETYYRFLRSNAAFESEDHRRNYLFRIATNLVRDQRRRPKVELPALERAAETVAAPGETHTDGRAADRIDVTRAMSRLKPRERSLLWMAYAQGRSHEEIAASLGVKAASLKSMLHRARRRLAGVLTGAGGSR